MSISSFEYYYSLNEVTKIEIDQINNLKDDKLFVLVIGNDKSNIQSISEKFIDLPIIKTNIKSLKGNKSFINIENTVSEEIRSKLTQSKSNGFTNIIVLIDKNMSDTFQSLAENNSLVDFCVHYVK